MDKKILYSLFIPSLLLIKNKDQNLSFIPINKGIIGYIGQGKGINFLNINNEAIIKTIRDLQEDFFNETKKSITLYCEVSMSDRFNILHSIFLGLLIAKKLIMNEELRVSKVIENCIEATKEINLSPIPFLAYNFRQGATFNMKNKRMEILKKIENKTFIIYCKDKGLVENDLLRRLTTDNYEKTAQYNKEAKIYFVKKEEVIKKLQDLILVNKPEDILIAKYYDRGIKIYKHAD